MIRKLKRNRFGNVSLKNHDDGWRMENEWWLVAGALCVMIEEKRLELINEK
jgi:uncharacterized membrane protein